MPPEGTGDPIRGNLDLMLLSALSDGPKYGYLIQQRLSEASRGSIRPQAGTLYPLLHRLEATGLVRSHWESDTGRQRKWYELTPKGKKRLVQRATQWRRLVDVVERLLGAGPNIDIQTAST